MPWPEQAGLPPLPGALVCPDLVDGQSLTFRIVRYELFRTTITPRDGRPPKEIVVLRLHVPAEDKPALPYYWDLGSRKVITGLLAYLENNQWAGKMFRLTKRGSPPTADYELAVTSPPK